MMSACARYSAALAASPRASSPWTNSGRFSKRKAADDEASRPAAADGLVRVRLEEEGARSPARAAASRYPRRRLERPPLPVPLVVEDLAQGVHGAEAGVARGEGGGGRDGAGAGREKSSFSAIAAAPRERLRPLFAMPVAARVGAPLLPGDGELRPQQRGPQVPAGGAGQRRGPRRAQARGRRRRSRPPRAAAPWPSPPRSPG